MLPLTIALAVAWLALTGSFDVANAVFGLVAGALLARLVPPRPRRRWSARRLGASVSLAGYFAWELVLANLRVAVAVLRSPARLSSAVVAVPLDAETDAEIMLFANLITLTPGTLSIDVSADRRVLYVHLIDFGGDLEGTRLALKQGFERRVLEALR